MRLPVIQGVIGRRILVNFRVDADVMQSQLPSAFRPKLQAGHAIAGICLIRLESERPRFLPGFLGTASENAAHRIAVRWDAEGGEREGVFIPRRDTGSVVNRLVGGRLFPGEHHGARFSVRESASEIDFEMRSDDGEVTVRVRGTVGTEVPPTSCFSSLREASSFFEAGAVGYSVTSDPARLDGLELRTHGWSVQALDVDEVHSSYFGEEKRFPAGSVVFDCALLMRNLSHEWRTAPDLWLSSRAPRST